jgi:sugar fermentation stimulation protein A
MSKRKTSADSAALARVRHEFDVPLVPGRLIRRYKRFLADVVLDDGQKVTAHCPNSGSMLGCLEDNAPVYLSPSLNPKRRTPYTWEMIYINQGWVGINTLVPNRLAAEAARQKALPLFRGAVRVLSEVKVSEHTRLDLLVERRSGPLYVEVKNVTLVQNGVARFPDARTTRGEKHLKELMRLKGQGASAAMLYVVQRGDARSFAPAGDIDPEYARTFYRGLEAGIEVVVVEASVSPDGIHLRRELPLAPA